MPETRDPAADAARDAWAYIRELVVAPDVLAEEHRFMRESGLTAGPLRALRVLLSDGPLAMRTLAERLGCDKSYVTSLVRPLVARELVTLEPDAADGRVKTVTPTLAGLALARGARRVHETPPAALRRLDGDALLELVRLLRETRITDSGSRCAEGE